MIVVDVGCNYRLGYQCLELEQSSPEMMPKMFDEVWESTKMNIVRLFFLSCPSNGEDEVYLEYLNPIFQIWTNTYRQERCAHCSCKAIIKLSNFYFLPEILSVQSIKWLFFFLTFIFLHVAIYIMRLLFSGFCYCLSETRGHKTNVCFWISVQLFYFRSALLHCEDEEKDKIKITLTDHHRVTFQR